MCVTSQTFLLTSEDFEVQNNPPTFLRSYLLWCLSSDSLTVATLASLFVDLGVAAARRPFPVASARVNSPTKPGRDPTSALVLTLFAAAGFWFVFCGFCR